MEKPPGEEGRRGDHRSTLDTEGVNDTGGRTGSSGCTCCTASVSTRCFRRKPGMGGGTGAEMDSVKWIRNGLWMTISSRGRARTIRSASINSSARRTAGFGGGGRLGDCGGLGSVLVRPRNGEPGRYGAGVVPPTGGVMGRCTSCGDWTRGGVEAPAMLLRCKCNGSADAGGFCDWPG